MHMSKHVDCVTHSFSRVATKGSVLNGQSKLAAHHTTRLKGICLKFVDLLSLGEICRSNWDSKHTIFVANKTDFYLHEAHHMMGILHWVLLIMSNKL